MRSHLGHAGPTWTTDLLETHCYHKYGKAERLAPRFTLLSCHRIKLRAEQADTDDWQLASAAHAICRSC
jgi:hypothetical protein